LRDLLPLERGLVHDCASVRSSLLPPLLLKRCLTVPTRSCLPSYEWQYSTDQKTWLNAPSTLQAKTEIDGLTAGTAYFFRFRGITKTGPGDYSQVVTLLVT
jgi:hypothetical protein